MPSDSPQVISDLDIRDEFASLEPEATFQEIAAILAKNEVKVILLADKGQREVVGIITEQRFLMVCATGIDPRKAIASQYMSTDILRLLDKTPLQATRDLIDDKEPDAVIVLDTNRKFRGYLSPVDYRVLRSLTKGTPVPPPLPPVVISDVQIRDEFESLDARSTLRDVAKILAKNEVKVVLMVDRGQKEVIGVITEQRFLQVCATGVDPEEALAYDYMSTDILRLLENTPIQPVIDLVEEKQPDAVIVLTAERKFRGYLSPEDYRKLQGDFIEPKPITDGVITLTEEEVSAHVAKHLAAGRSESVVWSEGGSEIVVHSDTVSVELSEGFARFSIEVECDQAERVSIPVRFYIGSSSELENLDASCESEPVGPSAVIGKWGKRLQDTLWSGNLDSIRTAMMGHRDRVAVGIGTSDHLLYIGTDMKQSKPIAAGVGKQNERGGR